MDIFITGYKEELLCSMGSKYKRCLSYGLPSAKNVHPMSYRVRLHEVWLAPAIHRINSYPAETFYALVPWIPDGYFSSFGD